MGGYNWKVQVWKDGIGKSLVASYKWEFTVAAIERLHVEGYDWEATIVKLQVGGYEQGLQVGGCKWEATNGRLHVGGSKASGLAHVDFGKKDMGGQARICEATNVSGLPNLDIGAKETHTLHEQPHACLTCMHLYMCIHACTMSHTKTNLSTDKLTIPKSMLVHMHNQNQSTSRKHLRMHKHSHTNTYAPADSYARPDTHIHT